MKETFVSSKVASIRRSLKASLKYIVACIALLYFASVAKGLAGVFFTIVSILLIFGAIYFLSEKYYINKDGLYLKPLGGNMINVLWEDIGEIKIEKDYVDKFLKIGTIIIENKKGVKVMEWNDLANPEEIRSLIIMEKNARNFT